MTRAVAPRVAAQRLFFILLIAAIASWLGVLTAETAGHTIAISWCRANVSPCQTNLSIPEGGTVELDLVLNFAPATTIPSIVAWETHHLLTDTSVAAIIPDTATGRTVQEQGAVGLALNGLTRITAGLGSSAGQYFTPQNNYNAISGELDYSVTLVGPAAPVLSPSFRPDPAQIVIGRVVIAGLSSGSSQIVAAASVNPMQVVTHTPAGPLRSTPLAAAKTPAATIRVGQVDTVEVRGKLAGTSRSVPSNIGSFPSTLALSFWQPGAVPAWRGGADRPTASYRGIVIDRNGEFRIADIAPSLVPAGIYDLRVKGDRNLARVIRSVVFPATGSPQPLLHIDPPILPAGDVDGSNIVDAGDVLILRNSFGQASSDPVFDDKVDLNRDGIVDVQDFSILSRNFGLRGD